jgi:two-component system, chemotaxis family, chemotaxis protein CheY
MCLVVAPTSDDRTIARSLLERTDFHVVEAEDGEGALAICSCFLPEAILLDWNLPVTDSYALLGSLLDLPGGERPRVGFCTTEEIFRQKTRVLNAGGKSGTVGSSDNDIVFTKFRDAGLLIFTAFPGDNGRCP